MSIKTLSLHITAWRKVQPGLDKAGQPRYNLREHLNMVCLQGRVKFPIGGKVRERLGADLVKLQNQQLQSGWKKMC